MDWECALTLGRRVAATEAIQDLVGAWDEDELPGAAHDLYTQVRPEVQKGKNGWGRKGELALAKIRAMAQR